MKTPIQKIIEETCALVADTATLMHDTVQAESPIEKIFFTALFCVTKYAYGEVQLAYADDPPTEETARGFIWLTEQAQIGPYRADFLLYVYGPDGWRKLVIECDGHDFHARTKEQAEHDRRRDREMQSMGYTVFRFPGSEIYRDPMGCAKQVIAWVHATIWGKQP